MSLKHSDEQSLRSLHSNPSRRKIPFGSARQKLNSTGQPTNSSQCMNIMGSFPLQTSVQQHQHLLDQNQYLRRQLKELKITKKTILRRLQDKQSELVQADHEYMQLIRQVSTQLERANSNIKTFIAEESKVTSKRSLKLNEENVANVSKSDTYRSRSKENLLKLKQVFQEMDFNVVEKLANKNKMK